MKLSKRKLRILFIALSILTILVVSLCSFNFRETSRQYSAYLSPPDITAVQNLASILNYQLEISSSFRGSNFVLLYLHPAGNAYTMYAAVGTVSTPGSVTVSGNDLVFTFNSNSCYVYFYDSYTGFWGGNSLTKLTINPTYIYYSSITVPASSIPSFTGFNSSALFGTSNFGSQSVLDYYQYIYDSVVYREERESELQSSALAEGQSEGFEVGYEDGYNQGYDSGFADGEDRGYAEGQTEGFSEGYSEGYSEGESVGLNSGYRDGFDDGREEGYTFGYDDGYDDGYKRGEDIGHQTGFDEGFESGYSEGYSDGYETGYNIVYDDLQEPGTIQAIFTTKDSSGNTLYLAQEMDTANFEINYAFLPKDQLSNSYVGYRLYVKTYDVTQYLEKNPLDFDYPLPVIEYNDTDFLSLYRKVNVTREYFDLSSVYSFVEVKIDQSFIDQLHNEYNEGLNDANALVNGIGDIASKPITSLKDALDFEIFGLNIGVVSLGIVAILFAIWAYNKIRKILPI